MNKIKKTEKNKAVADKNDAAAPAIFSFFAGAGFLDLGFESAGYNIVFVNEFHKPFLDIYKYSRHKINIPEPEYGYFNCDISVFLEQSYASGLESVMEESAVKNGIVGFIGGHPCPDFSVAGKNRGRTGINGRLSEVYAELICRRKPSFFLFENVKGLWRTRKHREFYEELKRKFTANGYAVTERLIDSIEYGAPQHRERIILIGFRKELLFDLGIKTGGILEFPWEDGLLYRKEDVLSRKWPTVNEFKEDSFLPAEEDIQPELTIEHWFRKNKVYSHPNAGMYFRPREGLKKFLVIPEGDDSKKSFKRLHRWRYSPAAAYGNNEVHLHPYKARRISAAEALAIQSLPEKFEIPAEITLTDAFKCIGNGVPYLASKSIAESIIKFLGGCNP